MGQYISEELRKLVAFRSDFLCEYCLIHEDDALFRFQIDHIVSLKHGGFSEPDNLAFACVFCNRHKGTDLGSLLGRTGELIRFFNPREDKWSDHFYLEERLIKPRTHIGEVTIEILRFNSNERISERTVLDRIGRYPTAAAFAKMKST